MTNGYNSGTLYVLAIKMLSLEQANLHGESQFKTGVSPGDLSSN